MRQTIFEEIKAEGISRIDKWHESSDSRNITSQAELKQINKQIKMDILTRWNYRSSLRKKTSLKPIGEKRLLAK